jgi:hypothetical protein
MKPHPLCTNIPFPANTGPAEDDYVSVFSGFYEEVLVFAASPGVSDARVYHSGASFDTYPVVGGVAQGLLLDHAEEVFVAACWETTRNFRHGIPVRPAVGVFQCTEPRVLMSLFPVVAYSRCSHCADLVGSDRGGTWYHVTPAGGIRERGCRAASFRTRGDWDDTLSKSLTAAPL